jgi:hypothetical protein
MNRPGRLILEPLKRAGTTWILKTRTSLNPKNRTAVENYWKCCISPLPKSDNLLAQFKKELVK